jgi:hypothetical protein
VVGFHCIVTRPASPTEPVTEAGITSPMLPPSLTVKVAFPDREWLESEMLSTTSAALKGAPLQAPQPETLTTIPAAGGFPAQIPLRLAVGDPFGARVVAGGPTSGVGSVPDPRPGPQAGPSAAHVASTTANRAGRVMTPQV